MTENPSQNHTRQKLLKSACQLFAEKGLHKATIAEICQDAGANVASVNYHFGSKKKLYDQTWRHASRIATETFPLDQGLAENPSAEECLRAFISAMLNRFLNDGPSSCFPRIMTREMMQPTFAFPAIHEEVLIPVRQKLFDIIRVLLGAKGVEEDVSLCGYSVMCQCLSLLHHNPVRKPMKDRNTFIFQEIDIMADHLVRFCLGGIQAVREREHDF